MDSNIGSNLSGVSGVSQSPSLDMERDRLLPLIKDFRKEIDALMQRVSVKQHPMAADSLVVHSYAPSVDEAYEQVRINLTNAKMWAGKMLEGLGNPFPAELADKATLNPPNTTGPQ